MQVKIHKKAKTTPAIRTEIQQSNLSAYAIQKHIVEYCSKVEELL
jgi:hypothetical protein